MTRRSGDPLTTYHEFWPHYLNEHSQRRTRFLHVFGTGLASASLIALLATANAWWALAALLGGYGPAWIAHFWVEHNRPATFRHPLWSLISDYRMAGLWLVGRLQAELDKAKIMRR